MYFIGLWGAFFAPEIATGIIDAQDLSAAGRISYKYCVPQTQGMGSAMTSRGPLSVPSAARLVPAKSAFRQLQFELSYNPVLLELRDATDLAFR